MKKLIKKIIEKTGYTLVKLERLNHYQRMLPLKIKHFLDVYFSNVDTQTFFFIQIGAHDGKHNDHLYPYIIKYKLKGLALEPQKDVFKQLQETYKDYSNVQCVNMAIGKKNGRKPFFTVKGESSLGTFNKSLLEQYKDFVQETVVDVITFDDLVNKFNFNKIDFLQIDCEGYDFDIIKMIDFKKFSPQIINYESVLLSEEDRKNCEQYLASLGYKMFRYERDTCAYKV